MNKLKLQLVFIFFGVILVLSMTSTGFGEELKPTQKQPERDPMVPQEMSIFQSKVQTPVKKVERAGFQVQGVGRGPRGAYVIIDGQAYAEGETRNNLTVVKINETSVDILSDGIPEALPIKKR